MREFSSLAVCQTKVCLLIKQQGWLSLFNEKALDFSTLFIALSLIVYPATVLLIPSINGLIFALFALTGVIYLFVHRKSSLETSRDERLFYAATGFFFIGAFIITLLNGFVYQIIGKYLHVFFAISVYIFLRYHGFRLLHLWLGLAIGAVISAVIALYEVNILNYSRAHSLTHPIIFGDLSLVMGCMSMAGLGWFKQQGRGWVILPIVALLSGILAGLLSVARGGWVAVPLLILVFFWYIKAYFSTKQRAALVLIVFTFLAVIYVLPQSNVALQIDRTLNNLQQYIGSEITSHKRASSVGTRLEMWRASWQMFLEHPVTGVGWGHYEEQAKLQVEQGCRNKSAAAFNHPHSEYFFALAGGGIVGFILLLGLFLVPAMLFVKAIRHGKSDDIKRLALAGLILIVAYMAFGLSEPLLFRSRSANFFGFYLAVFMAAIYHQNKNAAH